MANFVNFEPIHKITFKYKDGNREAVASKFITKWHKWYLITLKDGMNFVIAPSDTAATEWVQDPIPGEPVHPKEFIQAVGSGVKEAGIV